MLTHLVEIRRSKKMLLKEDHLVISALTFGVFFYSVFQLTDTKEEKKTKAV
jgi:hypothetical protein